MADKAWKKTERRIAEMLGGQRVPVTGRQRGDAPDVAHERFAVECKHKKTLPDWLHDAMAQAMASVRGEQLPLVVLHESGKPHAQDFVVMRLADVRDRFAELETSTIEKGT